LRFVAALTHPGAQDWFTLLRQCYVSGFGRTEPSGDAVLPIALARIRNDSVLSRKAPRPAGPALLFSIVALARALTPRAYFGGALLIVLIGIGVNALLLQHERHPAPFFAPPPQAVVNAPSAPPAAPPVRPAATAELEAAAAPSSSAAPPSRPAPPAEGREAAAPAADPIGDLLRSEGHADPARPVLAAQAALAKLGYSVKADGAEGAATEQAIRDFERAHGLPVSTEITPALVRQLNQAARSTGH
jgi:hypothetical protein